MKQLIQMTFILLLFLSGKSSSYNLFKVESTSKGSSNYLVIDNNLFYQDENKYLKQHTGLGDSSFFVLRNGNKVMIKRSVYFEGEIHFIDFQDNNLWKFDGIYFSKLSDKPIDSINMVADILVGFNDKTNTITALKDNNLIDYISKQDISSEYGIIDYCRFSDEHFIFSTYENYFMRYHEYKSGEINSDIFENLGYFNTMYSIPEIGCVGYSSNYISLKFKVINSELVINDLLEMEPYVYYQNLLLENNKLISIARIYDVENPNQKYKVLSIDLPSFEYTEIMEFSPEHYISKGMYKLENKIHLFSGGSSCDIPVPKSPATKCSPGGPIPNYFATLDLNTSDYKSIDGFYDSKSSYINDDIRILSSREHLHHELVLLDTGNEISSKVNYIGFNNYAIKGKNKLGEFFVIANDLINQRKQIFLLTEENYISPHLNGLWNNKDWSHQGLSIQTGTRQDSSTYLFASLLTFSDGNPLWLAGVSDINSLQENVELELYEYEGSSFLFEQEEFEPLKFNFGTLKITPQTCNSIHLDLKIKNSKELVSLEMQRIQNKEIDAFCSDE